MANKPTQGPFFKLPKGTVHTKSPGGGVIAKNYGKQPVECTYNPDRGQQWPRDPQWGKK